ncbi:MAG: hypothetical protein H6Q91_2078 [Deltaproteobacteria bacterium]|nr:hypothetical protein [Deltaproteobacteria bacterium]
MRRWGSLALGGPLDCPPLPSSTRREKERPLGRVRIHVARRPQSGGHRSHHPRRGDAVVPARREDRRGGPQRNRQEFAAAHPRGRRPRFSRRSAPGAGHRDRIPFPGAAARSQQGRARQRRGRALRDPRSAAPLRGAVRALRRNHERRRDERAARRAGQAAGPHRRRPRLGTGAQTRDRDGRAALPAGRREGRHAFGRRAAPCRPVSPALAGARPAVARRADQPSRRRVGGVARAPSPGIPGHGDRRDPRPLLPRQRRRVDPRTGSWRLLPVQGQLHLLARAEAVADGCRGEEVLGEEAHDRTRARVGADVAARAPGQGQGPSARLRRTPRRRGSAAARDRRDHDPARSAARRGGDRGRQDLEGLRRSPADRRAVVPLAARRHRRRDRSESTRVATRSTPTTTSGRRSAAATTS